MTQRNPAGIAQKDASPRRNFIAEESAEDAILAGISQRIRCSSGIPRPLCRFRIILSESFRLRFRTS